MLYDGIKFSNFNHLSHNMMVCLPVYCWGVEIPVYSHNLTSMEMYFSELNSELNHTPSDAYICLLQAWKEHKFYTEDWDDVIGKIWKKDGELINLRDGIWFDTNIISIANKLECGVSEIRKMQRYLVGTVNTEIYELRSGEHPYLQHEAVCYINSLSVDVSRYTVCMHTGFIP